VPALDHQGPTSYEVGMEKSAGIGRGGVGWIIKDPPLTRRVWTRCRPARDSEHFQLQYCSFAAA
jgi:hypothetical protein